MDTATSTRIGSALARLAEVAHRQHLVFTHEQALGCGVSPRSISRYVVEGRWRRLHPGVYVASPRGVNDLQKACAAVLAAGSTAVVSHMSAAALHELAPWPLHVHLTVPHGRHRKLAGVRWHQSRVLGPDDRTIVQAIPTTSVERSMLDAATQADAELMARLVDECVRLGKSDIPRLAAKALEVRPDGRFGGRKLRVVLSAVPELDDADSVMEMVMGRLLEAQGLEGFVHHHVVDAGGIRHELDFAFPVERVDIECDGAAYHEGPFRRGRDRRRDDALEACGWTVLRFSWGDLTAHAPRTARRIREALGR